MRSWQFLRLARDPGLGLVAGFDRRHDDVARVVDAPQIAEHDDAVVGILGRRLDRISMRTSTWSAVIGIDNLDFIINLNAEVGHQARRQIGDAAGGFVRSPIGGKGGQLDAGADSTNQRNIVQQRSPSASPSNPNGTLCNARTD